MKGIREYLSRVSPISNETWEVIEPILTKKTLRKGDFFAKTGRRENDFGILLEGIMRAYIPNKKGSFYVKTLFTPLHFKTPISFVGAFSSLVSNHPNMVMIDALTEVKIYTGKYKDWDDLSQKNMEVAQWSRRLAELFFMGKELNEFEFMTLQAEERYRLFRDRFPELENLISQYHIAHFLNITPTQLSRIRKKMFRSE